jgi:hypothetical protein
VIDRRMTASWRMTGDQAEKHRASINWPLLERLAEKDHALANIKAEQQELPMGVGEALQDARVAHHLLDLVGIPYGTGAYDSHLDARTWQAVIKLQKLGEQLDRIAAWHSRETAAGGMVGDFCTGCGYRWPCETRRMADGTHEDLTEVEA